MLCRVDDEAWLGCGPHLGNRRIVSGRLFRINVSDQAGENHHDWASHQDLPPLRHLPGGGVWRPAQLNTSPTPSFPRYLV